MVLAAYQYIVEHPGCTSMELARAIGINSHGGITSRLTTLQGANLIEERREGDHYHLTWWPL